MAERDPFKFGDRGSTPRRSPRSDGVRHNHLLGHMPVWTSGANLGNLDRCAAAQQWGLTKTELHQAYNNWVQLFKRPGTCLTFEEYLIKMDDAGIGPSDLGNRNRDYNLARYGDIGPYTYDSCRFTLQSVNHTEQKKIPPHLRLIAKHGEARAREIMSENGRRARLIQLVRMNSQAATARNS